MNVDLEEVKSVEGLEIQHVFEYFKEHFVGDFSGKLSQ